MYVVWDHLPILTSRLWENSKPTYVASTNAVGLRTTYDVISEDDSTLILITSHIRICYIRLESTSMNKDTAFLWDVKRRVLASVRKDLRWTYKHT